MKEYKSWMVPIGFLSAAVAMPAMLFERLLPRWPDMERFYVGIAEDDTWYHFWKNIWTELIRADPQWWGKFLAFVIIMELLVIAWLAVRKKK